VAAADLASSIAKMLLNSGARILFRSIARTLFYCYTSYNVSSHLFLLFCCFFLDNALLCVMALFFFSRS
jgi:hypothetical protein